MDPNVFAFILPGVHNASRAFKSRENSHLYFPDPLVDRSSRQCTPDVYEDEEYSENEAQKSERLELHFDDDPPLKDPTEGWQFGYSSQTSDVTICVPGTIGVSRRHFAISITPEFRIQFHQRTIQTTRVCFCSKSGHRHDIQPQKNESFFVCLAPWEEQYWNKIKVSVSSGAHAVCFEIFFPNHKPNAPQEYHDNLKQWLQTRASTLPPVSGLGLESVPSTVAPSRQSHTPPLFSSLCFQRKIGTGAFGVVELLVDLTTGGTAARKRFFQLSAAEHQDAVTDWDRAMEKVWNEVGLMQRNPHPNIMRVLAFQEEPVPSILMPYYRHGNIENMPLQPKQYHSVFRQLLLVLDYLHGRNVAHRDLKPENILVESIDPIRIVVSDFGLSREAEPGKPMTTFCGTRLYGAPDVFPSHQRSPSTQGYWVSVDIWSAGAIMLEWTYGRPDTRGMARTPADVWIKFWSETLLREVRRRDLENPGDPVMDILKHMVVLDPNERYQASECLQQGCDNGLFKRTRSGDVIDVEDDDPNDPGAIMPPPGQQAQPDVGSSASVVQKQDPGRGSGDNDSSLIQTSEWERFINFDLVPAYRESQEEVFLTKQEFLLVTEDAVPLTATAAEPTPAAKPTPAAGIKRKQHPNTSESSSSMSTSKPPKKRPVHAGFNSAVLSDVLGSKPRLDGEAQLTDISSSISVIDLAQQMAPASEVPTITPSMWLNKYSTMSS